MKASLVVNNTKLLELEKAFKEANIDYVKNQKKKTDDSEDSMELEPIIQESKLEVSFDTELYIESERIYTNAALSLFRVSF